jgi:hypothetical protein
MAHDQKTPRQRGRGPRPVTGPVLKTSVRIVGQRQIDTFVMMCRAAGRQPHQLAGDIVLGAILQAQHDAATQDLVRAARSYQARPPLAQGASDAE